MNSEQPTPSHNAERPTWEVVIDDMRERNDVGIGRYGTPLQPFNGRKSLVDAYQEILDSAVYIRQDIVEREQIVAELREMSMYFRMGNSPKTEMEKSHMASRLEALAERLWPS